MIHRVVAHSALLLAVFGAGMAPAAEPPTNWTAPPYWTPPSARELEDRAFGREPLAIEPEAVEALPSTAMPFVAITPCRLADTRGNGFTGSYGPPALAASAGRTMTITGRCGIPSGAMAVSFNVTVTNTLGPGFILAYPAGGSQPLVSTLNYVAGQTLANAAVVPLSDAGAATFVAGVSGTDLVLDVNGYYAPAGIVNTVNGLTGNLTLAQGTNVTITPSGSTLTIASTPGTHTHGAGDITSGTLADGRLGGTYTGSLALLNTSNALRAATLDLGTWGTIVRGATGLLRSSQANGSVFVGEGTPNPVSVGIHTTGVGERALYSLTTGVANTAFGKSALETVTTSHNNTAFGAYALLFTTGTENTAVGASALVYNTTGLHNTAVGFEALQNQTGGDGNTAIGHKALRGLTGGYIDNTALGARALSNLSSGAQNVSIGAYSGWNCTTGSANIYLGSAGSDESNVIRIGDSPYYSAAYIAGIWGVTSSGGAAVYVNSAGQVGTTTSSRRYKRDIADLGTASAVLMQLRPVSFRYTEDRDAAGERQYGLIAEEVAQVAPELVIYGRDGQPETVKYHLVNALALAELQEARRTNDAQERRIEQLTKALAEMAHRLAALEARSD